jgi:hypothetical protein
MPRATSGAIGRPKKCNGSSAGDLELHEAAPPPPPPAGPSLAAASASARASSTSEGGIGERGTTEPDLGSKTSW